MVNWDVLVALLRLPADAPPSGPAVECVVTLGRVLPSAVPVECAPLLILRLGTGAEAAGATSAAGRGTGQRSDGRSPSVASPSMEQGECAQHESCTLCPCARWPV